MSYVKVKMFKAQRDGYRYNKNQKVWIVQEHANYYQVTHKFRGRGRYIKSKIDKTSSIVGDIKEVQVKEDFALRHELQIFQ